MTRLQELATETRARFHTKKRTDGADFWTYDHDDPTTPEWLQTLCLDAHGSMAPDDHRYAYIVEALDALADNDDPDDVNIEADCYTHELCTWLGSHGHRPGYCDDAAEERGEAPASIVEFMQLGQEAEKREVFDSVRASLEAIIEAEEEEEEAEEDPTKPEEGDVVTRDRLTFYQHGKPWLTLPAETEQADAADAVNAKMQAENFFSNVWLEGERGGYDLLDEHLDMIF